MYYEEIILDHLEELAGLYVETLTQNLGMMNGR